MEYFEQIIDFLKSIDQSILLFINGLNHPFLDEIMWLLTGKFIWFPFYAILLFLVYKKTDRIQTFITFLLVGLIIIGLSDFIATHLFKYPIGRYRPSHHLSLRELLHFYELKQGQFYQGGQYGFVSGHATNSFAIAIYFGLFLRNFYKKALLFLVLWALMICYTRVYLGVHYPSDIIGGITLGIVMAVVGNVIFKKVGFYLANRN